MWMVCDVHPELNIVQCVLFNLYKQAKNGSGTNLNIPLGSFCCYKDKVVKLCLHIRKSCNANVTNDKMYTIILICKLGRM